MQYGACDPACNFELCGFDGGDCEGQCAPGCVEDVMIGGECHLTIADVPSLCPRRPQLPSLSVCHELQMASVTLCATTGPARTMAGTAKLVPPAVSSAIVE
eukprot:scaffold227844_cov46-Prasinocladus_malaysianus.AAC.1